MALVQRDFEEMAKAIYDWAKYPDGTSLVYDGYKSIVEQTLKHFGPLITSGKYSAHHATLRVVKSLFLYSWQCGRGENWLPVDEINKRRRDLEQELKEWREAPGFVVELEKPNDGLFWQNPRDDLLWVKVKRDTHILYPAFHLFNIEIETNEYSNKVLDEIKNIESGKIINKPTYNYSNETTTPLSPLEIIETATTFTSDTDKDLQVINTDQNTFYVVVDGPDWITAQKNAQKLGGYLVTINSELESELLGNEFSKSIYSYDGDNASWAPNEHSINHFWTGGTVNSLGQWSWQNGDEFNNNLSCLLINNNNSLDYDTLLGIFNNPNHHSNIYLDDSPNSYGSLWGWNVKGIAEIPLVAKEKVYSGEFSDYIFYNKSIGSYQIKSNDGIDSITGIKTLKFSDKSINLIDDIVGVFDQVTGLNTDSGEMFRLYNAAFARFPDADGLKYWIDQFSSGRNTKRVVAQSFLASAEFTERYGSNVSDETYVNNLYKNVLGRDADTDGLNYWVGNLSSGIETRYEALLGFAESAENKALFTEMTGFS